MAAPSFPRLLGGPTRPETYRDHVLRFGHRPILDSDSAAAVITDLDTAGLRGRGGSGFPTSRKWQAVAKNSRGDAVVVANGSEGEPASQKDRTLMRFRPHLIIDGLLLAAEVLAARTAVIVVPRLFEAEHDALATALEEREAAEGATGAPVHLVTAPHRYVAGEATAVVNYLNGREAKPGFSPPRTSERGVNADPTLVQNVETLAHVALIARYGPRWFREVGSDDSPGSAIVTVLGSVARPGVIEIQMGAPLRDVLNAAGGLTSEPRGILAGGYFGGWLAPDQIDSVRLDHKTLRAAGASFGCGVVGVLPADHCGLVETAAIIDFLARESAQQCGPCERGLPAVAQALQTVTDAHGTPRDLDKLRHWIGMIRGRGACNHPDGALMLLESALHTFSDDVADHLLRRPCRGYIESPVFPSPTFEPVWE